MTPHWTELQAELQQWLASSPRILLGCDFDGTLAPIVEHAAQAELPRDARRALERLVILPGVIVAVISGRSLADLRQRIGIKPLFYAGNHGLEMLGPDGMETIAPGVGKAPERLREVVAQLGTMLARVPGVWIEDKRLTASVHYRMAAAEHHGLIGEIVTTALQGIDELSFRKGKCVWEIRPSALWHKGTALTWFMKQCGVPNHAAAFMGDDVTDCDAFEVLDEGWVGVVGELAWPKARVRLRDPEDMARMLEWMADERVSAF